MMGAEKRPSEKLFYYNLSLEDRIPRDHILRRILGAVDFGFVRAAVSQYYGHNGHRSEDPIVILKLMFLLFFEDVKSERELLRQLPMRLDWLWFLGLDLDSEVPHHSVLSKARKRWGSRVFEELFVRVVRSCVEAGLVEGHKIHLDGSLVEANASQKSVIRGSEALISALKHSYGVQERKLELAGESEPEKETYKKQNRKLWSRTDPDASVVKQSRRSHSQLRYKHHRAVDDYRGVVTAVETTSGEVEENRELKGLHRQHCRNSGLQATTIVADSQYGTNENFAWCGRRGIRAHMGDVSAKHKTSVFGRDQFQWDEERDCYWCPAGHALKRAQARKSGKRKRWVYEASSRDCRDCELRRQCTRKQSRGRHLYRYAQQEAIDRARAQSYSPPAYRDRRRRRSLIEGSFADAANNHHFKRSRWRRLERQRMQDYLIAVCQNVRILLHHVRPGMSGAAAAPSLSDLSLWKRIWRHLTTNCRDSWESFEARRVQLSCAVFGF